MISHSVQARQFYAQTHSDRFVGTSDSMDGVVTSDSGKVLQFLYEGEADIFPLGALLQAANVDLEAYCKCTPGVP